MDQQKSTAKSKNTILKYLPRATSSVSFQNPPVYSPTKDKKPSEKPHKSHLGIAFSGPIITGDDTRRKIKNNSSEHTTVYEPTSPKVSCMGQVKCKYTKQKPQPAGTKPPVAGKILRLTSATPERKPNVDDGHEIKSKKKLGFKILFGGKKPVAGERKEIRVPVYLDKAPSLSTVKRFSSGREKLTGVDWTAVDSGDRRCDSDEESDDGDVIVPSSAPVIVRNIPLGFDEKLVRVARNTEPRKEINLWKRRTMPQPKPLLLA